MWEFVTLVVEIGPEVPWREGLEGSMFVMNGSAFKK